MPTLVYQLDPRINVFLDFVEDQRRRAWEEHYKNLEASKKRKKTRLVVGMAVGAALTGGALAAAAPAVGAVAAGTGAGIGGSLVGGAVSAASMAAPAAAAAVPAFSWTGALTAAGMGARIGESFAEGDIAGGIGGISEFGQAYGNIQSGIPAGEALAAARIGKGSQLALDAGRMQRRSDIRQNEWDARFWAGLEQEALTEGYEPKIPDSAKKAFGSTMNRINADPGLSETDRQAAKLVARETLRNSTSLEPRPDFEGRFRQDTFIDPETGNTIGRVREYQVIHDAGAARDKAKKAFDTQYAKLAKTIRDQMANATPISKVPYVADEAEIERRTFAAMRAQEARYAQYSGQGLVAPPPPDGGQPAQQPQAELSPEQAAAQQVQSATEYLDMLMLQEPDPSKWSPEEKQAAHDAARIVLEDITQQLRARGSNPTEEEQAYMKKLIALAEK